MLTRSKTERQREASAPGPLDSKDVGYGMSSLKIKTSNVRKRKSNFGLQKYERQGQQLLPGLLNEITLDLITPKLPWITFHTLLSVSSSWRQAIQSRQVYNARCRAHATEALIIISPLCKPVKDGDDGKDDDQWIGLYSMREEKVYRLPGIGHSTGESTGLRDECQCISLDGKVYVMGGLSSNFTSTRSMYVLDLVASKGWKRCASMRNGRSSFGCCIVDGKIFVCGGYAGERGRNSTKFLLEPEVYDPELDLWSSLKSMTSLRLGNQAAVLGDEILVHSGFVYRHKKRGLDRVYGTNFPEIYNPILDEWRMVEDPMQSSDQFIRSGKNLFVTQGKIHSIEYSWAQGKWRVQVYNLDEKSWTKARKSLWLDVPGKFATELATPLVVDDEIVRLIGCRGGNPRLIHSPGFSVNRRNRKWQTAKTPFHIEEQHPLVAGMSIIRL